MDAADCRLIRCPDLPERLEITGICTDSREIEKGQLFICMRGMRTDGHKYIKEAAEKGAIAILAERESWQEAWMEAARGSAVLLTEDTACAAALFASCWYGNPKERLRLIGVTGTKGKTTTACMIRGMLEAMGYRAGFIGTIGIWDGKEWESAENTTPDAFTIHRSFAKMVEEGCQWGVLEVSSQGIMKKRVYGLDFEVGVFTNFEKDHIGPGEHDSIESYRTYKARLFEHSKACVGNVDDAQCAYMFRRAYGELWGYSCHKEGTARQTKIPPAKIAYAGSCCRIQKRGKCGHTFLVGEEPYEVGLPGQFNVYNALAAIQTMRAAGLDPADGRKGLSCVSVRGRMERVIWEKHIACYVDYAHNPLSLQTVLETIREENPRRILTVFGCGGNRSKERRKGMGEASGNLSDLTIVTSDNPRMEDPGKIMQEIYEGVTKSGGACLMIEDRALAIRTAVMEAEPGDVVLVAGKGHETYQEIKGVRYPMDDRRLLLDAWEERRKKKKAE